MLVAEAEDDLKGNLGLADAAEALDGGALAVVGVRTRGDPREKRGQQVFAAYKALVSPKRDYPG
jgi:hypothetical protein